MRSTASEAASKLTAPLVTEHAESLLARHHNRAKHALDSAERRAKLIGKQAEPFQTTDLDGKPQLLSDYRGKSGAAGFLVSRLRLVHPGDAADQ